ncbi:hypothetical protein [Fibrella arboris]|uniref:pPIWI-associating nuclease domain-containing protein n=1 Tax=Fibrella arboris TaxID=3242486 RepID=UPI003520895E
MQIRPQYLQRYMHDIAVEQLMADYQAKGYQVAKEEKVGEYRADLVARKADEVVVFEVKVGKMTPQKRAQIVGLGDYVRAQKNYKFLVVVATPPKPKKIAIPNLDELLYEYIVDHFPDELNSLSSLTRIENVVDTIVDELTLLEEGGFEAKGTGTVEIELQYGPTNDASLSDDSFPFTFEIKLNQNDRNELILDEVIQLHVDTSSWDE